MRLLSQRRSGKSGKDAGSRFRLQSAMEYLMTYGWAILIIAVVLGALFQLGVFNAGTFAPRAPPGACQVFRPNGPGSTNFINTEGVCNGELPQYVAVMSSGYIETSTVPIDFLPSYTINFWAYPTRSSNGIYYSYQTISGDAPGCSFYTLIFTPNIEIGSWNLNYAGNWYGSHFTTIPPLNMWSMVTVVLTGGGVGTGTITVYLNGGAPNSQNGQETYSEGLASDAGSIIGAGGTGCPGTVEGGGFSSSLANFQVYNTSLSGPEVNALYLEGIGGAPIDLQNLVGWWPLNGNANDYSGNMNNGVPNNVVYTGSWESGYTAP